MVLLILYAASVLTALSFLFAPALSLYGSAYRTALEEAADGIDAWMILELTPARELTQANLGFRAGEFAQSVASFAFVGSLAGGRRSGGGLALRLFSQWGRAPDLF